MPIRNLEIPFPAKVLSVLELTKHLKDLVEHDRVLSGVWVQGEVSNLVKAASGHCYFTLKDGKAVLRAALWAGNRRRIKLDFKNGDQLMAFGSISVYAPRGEYQIIISDLRTSGVGELYEAYEKLKKKLKAEGLFDSERKLPIPFLPKGIGIVTSATGSVIQDIYRVIRRRFVNMPLYLSPAKVQGSGAAEQIVAGIKKLNKDPRVEVIIIGRGGGSLEDLWPFNEEIVARAVAESKKPIISAVGHETDTTIADLVADVRAATPSVAGELAVPVKDELLAFIKSQEARVLRSAKIMITVAKQRWQTAKSCRFLQDPSLLVAERRMNVMNLSRDLEHYFRLFVGDSRHFFEILQARLKGLNPKALLNRGYIIATDDKGNVATSVENLKENQKLKLNFADGSTLVSVEKIDLNGD